MTGDAMRRRKPNIADARAEQTTWEKPTPVDAKPVDAEPVGAQARAAQAWKLILAYDGTDFHGWQVQPGLRTVQGELAKAVFAVTGERVLPQGSGRTDAGVHAEGQAVSIELAAAIPPHRLASALNRRLPAAIRVVEADILPGFHARTGVVQKTYEYRVFSRFGMGASMNGGGNDAREAERTLLPWRSRFVWDCRAPLDLGAMQAAAQLVVGTHDFSSFAARDPDRSARLADAEANLSNVRSIFSSTWLQQEDMLLYRVTGNGFLHHMVRNLVGTFAEVGAGRSSPDSVSAVLAARDRRAAGPTAPAQGLFLMHVVYRVAATVHAPAAGARMVLC